MRRRSVYADRLLEFPELVLIDGTESTRRGAWRDHFASRIGPAFDQRVILEIGCNDASLLATIAAKRPTTAFVGLDWKCRALHTAAERVSAADLANVVLIHGRGQDIGKMFADEELDELWVFHPDPCDKPRELPNRLLAEPFLLDAHRVLPDGSSLVLKTDHRGYYQSMVDLFGVTPTLPSRFDVTAHSADFWNDQHVRSETAAKCFAGEATAYEARFRRKRLPIYYLELQKRSSPTPIARTARS